MYVEKSYQVPCFKVLPLVYSDAISYYEQVCQLRAKINEIVDSVNNINIDILTQANDYTDAQVKQAVDSLTKEFGIEIEKLNDKWGSEIADFESKINSDIEEFAKQIVLLNNSINILYSSFDSFKENMDEKFKVLTGELIDYINEHFTKIDRLYVVNPTNGKYEGIQKTLDDMYSFLNVGALMASEYDEMMLSASEYDNYNLTAFEYDSNARFEFIVNLYLRMFSPFTGEPTSITSVVYQLSDLHKTDTLLAGEYDDKGLTVTGYDEKEMSAYEYDWHGKRLLA